MGARRVVAALAAVAPLLIAGCGGAESADVEVTDEELAAVVRMGLNQYGPDNPTEDEWRQAAERLCHPDVTLEDLPELVEALDLVRPGMTTEIVVSGVWPIWGAACHEKVAQMQAGDG